jgi:hypothetical protein
LEKVDQAHGVARVQALLDLALELRVQHLGRQHERGARKHVFRQQLDAFRQQRVQSTKLFTAPTGRRAGPIWVPPLTSGSG